MYDICDRPLEKSGCDWNHQVDNFLLKNYLNHSRLFPADGHIDLDGRATETHFAYHLNIQRLYKTVYWRSIRHNFMPVCRCDGCQWTIHSKVSFTLLIAVSLLADEMILNSNRKMKFILSFIKFFISILKNTLVDYTLVKG